MLDRRPSQIGRHFRKLQIKLVDCPVLFRPMHQMFCCVKPLLGVINLQKLVPAFHIHPNQILHSSAVNPQRMADGKILFFDFYAIAGCYLHTVTSYFSSVF